MGTELTKRTPETALQTLTDWTRLGPDARRVRAAQALQRVAEEGAVDAETGKPTDGATELLGLTVAYTVAKGARSASVSPHTLTAYRAGTLSLLRWAHSSGLGLAGELHHVTAEQAGGYRAWLTTCGAVNGQKLSASSANARLRDAKITWAALQWAGIAPRDAEPFNLRRVRDVTPAHAKRKAFTDAEVDALLAATRDSRERVLVLLGADAALRVSEAGTLTWGEVDWTQGRVWVTGKGGKRDWVLLTERTVEALRTLWEERGRPGVSVPILGITRQRVLQILKRLTELAGTRPLGYHSLRHRCGTSLQRAHGNIVLTARHLRHSDPSTSAIYAKMDDAQYASAVDALGKAKAAA